MAAVHHDHAAERLGADRRALTAALALVVSDAAITGGLGLEVAGVVAASAALALVTGLAWRHARGA